MLFCSELRYGGVANDMLTQCSAISRQEERMICCGQVSCDIEAGYYLVEMLAIVSPNVVPSYYVVIVTAERACAKIGACARGTLHECCTLHAGF